MEPEAAALRLNRKARKGTAGRGLAGSRIGPDAAVIWAKGGAAAAPAFLVQNLLGRQTGVSWGCRRASKNQRALVLLVAHGRLSEGGFNQFDLLFHSMPVDMQSLDEGRCPPTARGYWRKLSRLTSD